MNTKIIEKFDELLQNTTNKKLSTFDEIVQMMAGLIELKVKTNQDELIQRVTQHAKFTSVDEVQKFLNSYFGFNNELIKELDRLEYIEGDEQFNKEIALLTKNILKVIPKEHLRESIVNFIFKILEVVMEEYPIKITDNHDETLQSITKIFGDEDTAFLFLSINTIIPIMQEKNKLSFGDIVELTTPVFIFCIVMNHMRKEDFHASQEMAESPLKPVNSVAYKVARNDPCPCGSGRKYKVCCRGKTQAQPLDTIMFKEPKDILPPLTKDEVHEFYAIWSRFLNYVSKVYSEASKEEYIKIYDKNKKGEYHFTPKATQNYHYITIRNFLSEYFHMLVGHFIDDNRVSEKKC